MRRRVSLPSRCGARALTPLLLARTGTSHVETSNTARGEETSKGQQQRAEVDVMAEFSDVHKEIVDKYWEERNEHLEEDGLQKESIVDVVLSARRQ